MNTESSKETLTFTDSVVFEIIKEFGDRANKGYEKYGTDMDRTDLSTSDWAQHLREELMDSLVYLTRLKKDIIAMEEELSAHRANKELGTKIAYNIVETNQTEKKDKKGYSWHY